MTKRKVESKPVVLVADLNFLAAGLTSSLRAELSCLFLWGNRDYSTTTTSISKAHKFIPRLQDVALDDKGHWILVEAREEVTEKVIDWLVELSSIVPKL